MVTLGWQQLRCNELLLGYPTLRSEICIFTTFPSKGVFLCDLTCNLVFWLCSQLVCTLQNYVLECAAHNYGSNACSWYFLTEIKSWWDNGAGQKISVDIQLYWPLQLCGHWAVFGRPQSRQQSIMPLLSFFSNKCFWATNPLFFVTKHLRKAICFILYTHWQALN